MNGYELRFDVVGLPAPQGSKAARVVGDRAVMYDDNAAKLRKWREAVAATALNAMEREHFPKIERGHGVYLVAVFLLPKPIRPRYALPVTRPDLDKLLRAIGDALTTAGVYDDDAQITDEVVRKRYASERPGVRIAVRRHRG